MSTLSIKRLSLLSLSSTTIVLLYLQCSSLLLLSSSTTMAMESIIPNDLIVTRCKQNCPQQLNLDDDLDIACNSTCKIEQCQSGCEYWHNRPVACFDVCQNSSTIDNWIIYCAIGCNHAHTVYVEHVRSMLGTPSAPSVVSGSITNQSLTIEWKPIVLTNITHRIQWKYANVSSTWSYTTPDATEPNGPNRLHLHNLYAYSSYQFRIEWLIVPWLRISIHSKPSEPITTLPYGVPSTPCIITTCLPISSSQISVNWRQPDFPNGPIIAYTLDLMDNHTSHRIVKDLQMHGDIHQRKIGIDNRIDGGGDGDDDDEHSHSMNYVFNGLKSNTEYTITIVTFNNFGEGPICRRTVMTLPSSSSTKVMENEQDSDISDSTNTDMNGMVDEEPYKLFIATTSEVARRHTDTPSFDEEIIYHLTDYTESHRITGMAIHVRMMYLFVSDSGGTVRRVSLKENNQEINQVIKIINGNTIPSHLSMDWLNDRLYLVEDGRICRCNLDGDAMESVVVGFRSRPIDMKVDPYNGYLFWLIGVNSVGSESATTTGLYRVDLADLNTNGGSGGKGRIHYTNGNLIFQSKRSAPFNTFAINYFDYRIYFPVAMSKNIHSITIDGKDEEAIRDNANSPDVLVDIENMIIYDRRLYFTKGGNISVEDYNEADDIYYHNSYHIVGETTGSIQSQTGSMSSSSQANSANIDSTLVSILVMDNQSQPFPVPLNPVERVQAIFLDTSATISWEKPTRFGGSGRGAWQDWRYEVSIEQQDTMIVHMAEVNNVTNCVADELKPDTEYAIKVRAWSPAGKGAWSDVFRGRTWPSMVRHPYALIGTDDGLFRIDIGGKMLEQLIPRSRLNDNSIINSIVTYHKSILFNTNSSVWSYDTTNGLINRLGNITNAASIQIEPLAGKVYWSIPFERMICRSNIDGSQMEILPIMTYAQQIEIDSINGILYWSTKYAIKYSLLNGMKRSHGELTRSDEIKSIVINHRERTLYWITRNSIDNIDWLYRTILLSHEQMMNGINWNHRLEAVTKLPDSHLIGPMSSFANRLFWLQTELNVIKISDPMAITFATLKQLSNVYSFHMVHDSYDDTETDDEIGSTKKLNVIPDSIDPQSIRIEGTWENFTFHWPSIENVNYGSVYYDLVLEDHDHKRTNVIVNQTWYNCPDHLKPLKPYLPMRIAIRPFTYWASARQTVLTLHTPSSIPSKPRDIRVFIYVNQSVPLSHQSSNDHQQQQGNLIPSNGIAAEARWRPPLESNGIIHSYTVSLWTVLYDNKADLQSRVIENDLHIRFDHLKPNATYYFEVRAATDAGEGPPSDVYQFKTFTDSTPSRLLLAESDSILLSDMDLRQNEVVTKSINPLMIDYVSKEDIVFWVEDGNYLKRTSLNIGNNYTLIAQLHEPITGLTVDWIGRRLYLATIDRYRNQSTIWSYDYSHEHAHLIPIHLINGMEIPCLRINPYGNELIWTETATKPTSRLDDDDVDDYYGNMGNTMKMCQLENYGTSCITVRRLFGNNYPQNNQLSLINNGNRLSNDLRTCNCSYNTPVGPSFALDFSNVINPTNGEVNIIYYDLIGHHWSSTNKFACQCQRLTSPISGSIPNSVAFDYPNLYWTNDTKSNRTLMAKPSFGKIYRTTLDGIDMIESIVYPNIGRIQSMIGYNPHQQPYPEFGCLMPHHLRTNVQMIESSAYSLTLRVIVMMNRESNHHQQQQQRQQPLECGHISLPSLRYRIRYRKHYDNVQIDCRRVDVQQCVQFDSDNDTFTINDLEPFTNYTISIELDNFYLSMSRASYQHSLAAHLAFVLPTDEMYRHLYSENFIFRTSESRPGPPRNVRALIESPERIMILWNQPDKLNSHHITYEVWWYSVELNRKSVFHSNDRTSDGSFYMHLDGIKPGKVYNVSVRAYADNHQYMESVPIMVRAYDDPAPLRVTSIDSRSITLKWDSPMEESIIDHHQLYMQKDNDDDFDVVGDVVDGDGNGDDDDQHSSMNWTTFVKNLTLPNSTYEFRVKNLLPNTRYRFQLTLTYTTSQELFVWPRKLLLVTTMSDVPDTPIINGIVPISNSGDSLRGTPVFKVSWDPVKSNTHEPNVYYSLYEATYDDQDDEDIMVNDDDIEIGGNSRRSSGDEEQQQVNGTQIVDEDGEQMANSNITLETNSTINDSMAEQSLNDSKWKLVYNGTDTFWVITGLESGRQHLFRLAAANSLGRSNFTSTTEPFYLPIQDISLTQTQENRLLVFTIITLILMFSVVAMVVYVALRRYKPKEKTMDNGSIEFPIELVPWGELPHPHMPNQLYINSNVETMNLGDIKVIDFNMITRGKHLGKGNFGEVYEGILHKSEQKVAIKILNKFTADDQINFLKEAKFMSRFQHENILKLLGVCLNAEQPIIVMELMDGGDLLNYLRRNRPSMIAPSPLTMDDLLSITIDIVKGCEYLESLCTVHRDLAARNCLVSSFDSNQRVVKIADFGLTRAMYKQNYYRKEGGMLPVKWMSPESLVDGVFTTKSDVWAFGIVMYEVMTFAEQPYPGMSNEEVLKHVRVGKTLTQPIGCPFEIYVLMQQCWAYDKDERPNFTHLRVELESIRRTYQTLKRQHVETANRNRKMTENQLNTVHNLNYIGNSSSPSSSINSNGCAIVAGASNWPTDGNVFYSPYHNQPLINRMDEYHFPSRLTSATLVLGNHHHNHHHPQTQTQYLSSNLSTSSSSVISHSRSNSNHSQNSQPNLNGPYLNANGRPATIYEGADTLMARSIVDLEGYVIPIRT